MQKLNNFTYFNLSEFLENKILEIANIKEHRYYVDGQPGDIDGVTLTVAIVKDSTDYGIPGISNLYQTFNIIINGARLENVLSIYKPGARIGIAKYSKATVYGNYRNQLSVKCNDISDVFLLEGGER